MRRHIHEKLFFIVMAFASLVWSGTPTIKSKALLGGDGLSNSASAIAISPNGNYIAVAISGRGIYGWDRNERKHRVRFLSKAYTDALDIDDAGRLLALTAHDHIILLHIPADGVSHAVNLEDVFDQVTIGRVGRRATSIRFVDENHAVLAWGTTIELWDLAKGKKERGITTTGTISNLRLNTDRTKLVTSSYDTNAGSRINSICLLDTQLLHCETIQGQDHWKMDARFQPCTDTVGYLHGFYNLFVAGLPPAIQVENVCDFAFHSLDGYWLAHNNKKITLNTLSGPSQTFKWPWSNNGFDQTEFSNDGSILASWSSKDGTRLWYLPAEGATIPDDDDTGRYIVPSPNSGRSHINLDCVVSPDKKQLTITVRQAFLGPIYWRTTESDGEICAGGESYDDPHNGVVTIELQEVQQGAQCIAFYTKQSWGP